MWAHAKEVHKEVIDNMDDEKRAQMDTKMDELITARAQTA